MARTAHPSLLKRQKEQVRLARAEEQRAAKRASAAGLLAHEPEEALDSPDAIAEDSI
jgi:hypothetical protein